MRVTTIRAALFTLLVATSVAFAQSSGGEFEIQSSTIDNGGGLLTGGEFSLVGTIGQPDANAQKSVGGEFSLAGGFWANTKDLIFSDGFE